MKKRILLAIFFVSIFILQLYSQPTSEIFDVYNGSRIAFGNLYSSELDTLYIYKWSLLESQPDNQIYILKQNDIDINKKGIFKTFFVKKSEFDDNIRIITLVYLDKVMILKIHKNKSRLSIYINDMYFKEGIYNIDLKKLYDQYRKENIIIKSFPTDEDIDLTKDKIVTISQQ